MLSQRLRDFADAVADRFVPVWTAINGTGAAGTQGLTTTASDLVGAVNELKVDIANAVATAGAQINDVTASGTEVYSSARTDERINELAAQIVATNLEGEDLSELAAAVAALAAADMNLATAASVALLTATVDNKANTSDIYTRAELGDIDFDLAGYFTAL